MRFLILAFCLFISQNSSAKGSADFDLSRFIKKSKIHKKHLGMLVGDASSDKIFWSLNGEKSFIPASLTKIATGAALLEKFSPDHQLVTKFVSEAKINNGVLKGDLILKGDGDPGFVSESLWYLVNVLTRSGVKKVTGDLVVDDTKFDEIRFDKSRGSFRVDRAYDSPIGGLTFNWSATAVFVRPGDKVGAPAKAFADPACEYIKVVNNATTVKGSKSNIRVIRIDAGDKPKGYEKVQVTGTIGLNAEEAYKYKAIKWPALFAGSQAKCFLQRRGIEVVGKVRRGKASKKVRDLASMKSKSVARHVWDMMKFSNNYVAEIMTKNLAATYRKTPAVLADGVNVISDYLTHIGLKDFKIVNPSGLTRSNSFQPTHFYKILQRIHSKFQLYPEYISSLPVGGVDGTLKKRMRRSEGMQIRAKTGQLSGVVGLSGYVANKDGQQLIFVFVYNGPRNQMFKARDMFDILAVRLTK